MNEKALNCRMVVFNRRCGDYAAYCNRPRYVASSRAERLMFAGFLRRRYTTPWTCRIILETHAMPRKPTRRDFLTSAAAATSIALLNRQIGAAVNEPGKTIYCAFIKPLQHLTYGELADRIAAAGFDGIEAPVRPRGYIEPERVEDELPQLVEALSSRGLTIPILTSGITAADQTHTAKVLATAAKLGIPLYRMGNYKYDLNKSVEKQLDDWKPIVRELATYSREVGIVPMYQNHSGRDYVGAPLWDLHVLMEGLPPEEIGVAFDLGHATMEGGVSWPIQVNLLRPRMKALYVKDARWKGHSVEWVPLGEGRSDSKFYRQMRYPTLKGPLSVHVEYLDHKRPRATTDEFMAAFKRDLELLKKWQQA